MSRATIQHFEEMPEGEQDALLRAIHQLWEPSKEPNYRYGAPWLRADLAAVYPNAWRLSLEAFKEALIAAGFRLHNRSDEWAFIYLKKRRR